MGVRTLRIALLTVLVAASVPGSAEADLPPDERRTHDRFYQWSTTDDFAGHNHFQITLYGPASYPDFPTGEHTGRVTRVEVTTYVPSGAGFDVRRFSGPVFHPVEEEWPTSPPPDAPGTEGFSEGPCYPCGPYGMLFFALPHDFGDVQAIVDVRLWLPQAEGDCTVVAVGPCAGNTAGYVNPGFVGIPNPYDTDAGDAIPSDLPLH